MVSSGDRRGIRSWCCKPRYKRLWTFWLKYFTKFAPEPKNALLESFDEKHGYYFRFENESHHAGEYQNYIEDFAKCMNAGTAPKPDLKEGIHTLAVMEAMDGAVRTGSAVKVSDVLKRRNIEL